MFKRLKQFFGAKKVTPEEDPQEKLQEAWYDEKSKLLEAILGPMHEMVMHSIFPFAIGGPLHLYFYTNSVPGTGIATKQLSELPDEGSANSIFSSYELVMFTRYAMDIPMLHVSGGAEKVEEASTPYRKAYTNIKRVLNLIARYSEGAKLNPHETCEFPADMEEVGGKCVIFDAYGEQTSAMVKSFGVLAIIEIHRSEMEFARAHGSGELFSRLKAAGYYPYSDLDREPVVSPEDLV